MQIFVGSKNPIKVAAVKEIIFSYEVLKGAVVTPVEVSSGVSDQPKSLGETILGAKNRAFRAFEGGLGVGIEGGLIEAPHTQTGWMNICAVVIHSAQGDYTGLSSGFEVPPRAIEKVLQGMELDPAYHAIGLTNNPRVGKAEGVVGLLTNGRVDRKEYIKQALVMAMAHLENADIYKASEPPR